MAETGTGQRLINCPECGREASHKRYCTHCGALLWAAPAVVELGEQGSGRGAVRLEIDAARVLQQHAAGVLELRLTNTGVQQMQLAVVEIETPVVEAPLRHIVRDLQRGRHAALRFSIMPVCHGEAVCRVRVKALDAAQIFSVHSGEFAATINPPHVEETTLQFVIRDSDVVGDFENVFTQKRRAPRSVVQPRRRAAWVPIGLVEEERREVRPVAKRIVDAARLRDAPPMEAAALRLVDEGAGRTVALLAKTQIALGRASIPDPASGEHNDVVLRLRPDTAATRDLSRRIHRFAFQLRVSTDDVQLAHLARREGRVAVDTTEPVAHGEPIDVAGLFSLLPRIVRGPDHLRWSRLDLHRGTDCTPEIELSEVRVPSPGQILAVVLGRSDDADEREEYVIVRRHATIGASAEAAIVIKGPGVAGLHARLIAKAGAFFIEDLASADGTWVNQRRLLPDELVPLRYGDSIVLGRVPLAFEPFVQDFGGPES